MTAKVSDLDIHITDSHKVPKCAFTDVLEGIIRRYPNKAVTNERTVGDMRREWATHNLCYDLHICRSRTASVDLNWPRKWWEKLAYGIVGTIALIFIK